MIDEQAEAKALQRLEIQANPLDYVKPTPRPGDLLCNGCWSLSGDDKGGWTSYGFKCLENQTLCPECAFKYGHDLQTKQRMGL